MGDWENWHFILIELYPLETFKLSDLKCSWMLKHSDRPWSIWLRAPVVASPRLALVAPNVIMAPWAHTANQRDSLCFAKFYRQVLFEAFFGSGCERRYAETTRIRRVASRVPLPAHHSSYSALSELVVRSDSGSRARICERAEGGGVQQMLKFFFTSGKTAEFVNTFRNLSEISDLLQQSEQSETKQRFPRKTFDSKAKFSVFRREASLRYLKFASCCHF